ncbi:MAG: response regulator [Candidatus Tectomicrobia bacterium]|jgi:phosphate regulon transcriptional regulator PhoB|nr:response regulator [Candidatus Tectomicrobia bacterium]HEX2277827.1 response regulator [Candidatus Tectomicrobia bacterium]
MPARVLVIDDEKDIVSLLRYHLEKSGFHCLEGMDGSTALRLVREYHPDLLILDLMLPGMDGLEICRQLRQDVATARLPILMLTAKAEEVDRVVGLEVGADDYVVKPFSPRELVARVRAILRRAQEPAEFAVKRIGELEVDESRHSVGVQGTPVELTAKEFGLLCALMRANGRVLNREQLLEGVWGYADAAEIESRTVDVHIRRLREKLGSEAKRIVTVKGVGYRFDTEG